MVTIIIIAHMTSGDSQQTNKHEDARKRKVSAKCMAGWQKENSCFNQAVVTSVASQCLIVIIKECAQKYSQL